VTRRKGYKGSGRKLAAEIVAKELERCQRGGFSATTTRRRLRRSWADLRRAIEKSPTTFPRVSRRAWYHAVWGVLGHKLLELEDFPAPRQQTIPGVQ
jgi:hypothetical protein